MADKNIKYIAFTTPFGQYEYQRIFGLKNALACFQRFVNEVLSSIIETGNVIMYMDDFLIATDTLEEHFILLDRVLRLLVENLLELRLDKCRFTKKLNF